MTSTTVNEIEQQRHRSDRGGLPLATSSTLGWLPHVFGLPEGKPTPGSTADRVPLLITHASRTVDQIDAGYMRTVTPNPNPDSEWPWVVTDRDTIGVRGVVANDFVEIGDQVWAPDRGTVTVATVTVNNGVIERITARGSAVPIITWFRTQEHKGARVGGTPVHPGDFIVVEQAVGTDAYQGKVARVMTVGMDGRPTIEETPTTQRQIERWILVRRADSLLPEPGTLVIPREFLPGAKAWYVEKASELVGVAEGEDKIYTSGLRGAWLNVMMPHVIEGMGHGHHTAVRQWSIVGHKDSKHQHLIDGWQGTKPEATEVRSGERVDGLTAAEWKTKWDALWEALNKEANRRDWCEEYDDFAAANGGPERQVNWRIVVDLTCTIDASVLDEVLRAYLSNSNATPDVQESVEVTNRIEFEGTYSQDQIDCVDNLVEDWLLHTDYIYDSFEVVDYSEN